MAVMLARPYPSLVLSLELLKVPESAITSSRSVSLGALGTSQVRSGSFQSGLNERMSMSCTEAADNGVRVSAWVLSSLHLGFSDGRIRNSCGDCQD